MQVMVPLRYELFVEDMIFLVESGEIPMARIDDAVERILRVKCVAGLFEFPFTDRSLLDKVGCKVTFAEFSTWSIDILACFKCVIFRKCKSIPNFHQAKLVISPVNVTPFSTLLSLS